MNAKYIVAYAGTSIKFIRIGRIAYVESNGHDVIFHCLEENVTVRKNLKDIEKYLEEKGFLRVHRSYIVAIDHIKEISSGWIAINDAYGSEIPVSETYEKKLKEEIRKRDYLFL